MRYEVCVGHQWKNKLNLYSDKVEPEQTLYKILNTHGPLACFFGEGKCHLKELHQSLLKKCWFLCRSSTMYFKYSYCFQVDFKSCLKSHAHKRYIVSLLLNNLKIQIQSWNDLYTIMCCTEGWNLPHPCLWTIEPVKNGPFHTKDILPPILQM